MNDTPALSATLESVLIRKTAAKTCSGSEGGIKSDDKEQIFHTASQAGVHWWVSSINNCMAIAVPEAERCL